MEKKNIILVGPFTGELYWEFFRFAPYVFWKYEIEYNKNYPLVVLTRPDRYDIYGTRCIEFFPLKINGDCENRFAECFRMIGLDYTDYKKIIYAFKKQVEKKYNIIEHLYPPFLKPHFSNKDFYPVSKRIFEYSVRKDNIKLINKFIKGVDKPIIILAPRYRNNFKRNWPYWDKLYDKIIQTKWNEHFEFIICGKKGEYIPDKLNRFKDINDIGLTDESSLFGLLLEIMKRAKLTIGSQSAIPNISLLFKIPAIEWGNQKTLHTKNYNIYNTKVKFFETNDFKIPMETIFNAIVFELTHLTM